MMLALCSKAILVLCDRSATTDEEETGEVLLLKKKEQTHKLAIDQNSALI